MGFCRLLVLLRNTAEFKLTTNDYEFVADLHLSILAELNYADASHPQAECTEAVVRRQSMI